MFKIFVWLVALLAADARAARPFVTDDARLTNANSCQLESWMRSYPDSQEFWALPACNFGGNFEVTAGGGAAHNISGNRHWTSDYVFQAKTLFKPLDTNDWGIGLAAGNIHHPQINPGPNLLGNYYAYVPMSLSLRDDLFIIHANLGWLRDKASGRDQTTWGLGTEINMNQRWTWIAESFGSGGGQEQSGQAGSHQAYWQAGLRYGVIPGLLQVDATYGRPIYQQPDNSRWLSIGIRMTPTDLLSR